MKPFVIYASATLIALLLCAYTTRTSLVTFVTVNDATARCRFSFPDNYDQRNETEATMYSVYDDDITYEMHHRNTTTVESLPGQNFQAQTNSASQAYKLQQFTASLAQATGGQIVNQFAVTANGQQGREVEIDYLEEGDTYKMYVRFFWHSNTMYAFSISSFVPAPDNPGAANKSANAVSAKNQVFGSINFY